MKNLQKHKIYTRPSRGFNPDNSKETAKRGKILEIKETLHILTVHAELNINIENNEIENEISANINRNC